MQIRSGFGGKVHKALEGHTCPHAGVEDVRDFYTKLNSNIELFK